MSRLSLALHGGQSRPRAWRIEMSAPTDFEKATIEKILRRMRRQTTAVNRQAFTIQQVLEGIRREAYEQERLGAQRTADLLDAADNVILTLQIKLADQERFRGR